MAGRCLSFSAQGLRRVLLPGCTRRPAGALAQRPDGSAAERVHGRWRAAIHAPAFRSPGACVSEARRPGVSFRHARHHRFRARPRPPDDDMARDASLEEEHFRARASPRWHPRPRALGAGPFRRSTDAGPGAGDPSDDGCTMKARPLAILKTGLMTAVGSDATSCGAAFRSKLTNPTPTRFMDSTGTWILAHQVELENEKPGLPKLARMAATV